MDFMTRFHHLMLSLATFCLLIASQPVGAQSVRYKPVSVSPQTRDEHTLLLATFNRPARQADFARGNPALRLDGATIEAGVDGKAVRFGKSQMAIDPAGNINARAGTIELVMRNTNYDVRHRWLGVGSRQNSMAFLSSQVDASFYWFAGGGKSAWIRDISIREDFGEDWFYVVMGWDCDRKVRTAAIFDLNGQLRRHRVQYIDSVAMTDDEAAKLAQAKFESFVIGAEGLVIDTLRVSSVYRTDLLELERDWGRVEQFGSYSGRSLFDRQTMLKSWTAGQELKGVRATTFEPVIRKNYKPTSERKPPVPAMRCSPGDPVFDLDLGTLDIGCYVVRVIAAVKTEDIEQYRKPVYVDLKVNDQPGGGESHYRHRVPYWDDFYAVTELYFNADEKRAYKATLGAGAGGMADLYIHSIELHDTLAGLPRVAAKSRATTFTPAERAQLRANVDAKTIGDRINGNVFPDRPVNSPPLDSDARRRRDELLWNAIPPINSQFIAEYDEGFAVDAMRAGEMTVSQAAKEHGSWQVAGGRGAGWRSPLELSNEKLNLTYTRDDLAAHRPLPDPYPFKDDGKGVYFPQTGDMKNPAHFMPIAQQLGLRWQQCWLPFAGWHGGDYEYRLPYRYHAFNDREAARDAAFLLARWAYIYPTHTDVQSLGYATISPASMYNRDMRLVQRAMMFYWGSSRGMNLNRGLTLGYDLLFDFIKGNQELADAVGRFIPWVKTDEDVRRLIETRIVQYGAKQSMRFQLVNSKEHSTTLMQTAIVQQDADITRTWMESLWANTHIYPHPNTGLPDFISTTTQRDGTTDIGSVFYTWSGSPFLRTAAMSRQYVANGGDAKFDLTDFALYGKLPVACRFPLDSAIAGGFPMTVGDVGNPAKPRLLASQMQDFEDSFRTGYAWTGDPELAWIILHYLGRRGESDEKWSALVAAAERQGRNPFLAQKSRVMANWAGVLEAGRASDDYRIKRTAYMRVGNGHGHAHFDTLDLQVQAHGLRMVNDLGHRGSYNMPKATQVRVHNRIETGGKNHPNEGDWGGHSYVDTFVTTGGAQYMRGVAVPTRREVRLFNRAVAMIDADHGDNVGKPASGVYHFGETRHEQPVKPRNSYVFDVQRIVGGEWQTFNFHGPWADEFEVNIRNQIQVGQASHDQTPKDTTVDGRYLFKFLDGAGLKYTGDAPEDGKVVATWRVRRADGVIEGYVPHSNEKRAARQANAERLMLQADYRDDAPPKFTRLHLMGRTGDKVMVGYPSPTGPTSADMTWPFLMVQNRTEEKEPHGVYPAVIEPYAGEPFIRDVRQVEIAGNDTDALRAVAVQVQTTGGRTDLCFSDGHSGKTRTVGDVVVTAQFAFVSTDAAGLRAAQLVEGTELRSPLVRITPRTASHVGKVTRVDYPARRIWLDAALPEGLLVGSQCEIGNDAHRTSFTIVAAEREGDATVLTFDKPADLSYAKVVAVEPGLKRVFTTIGPAITPPGMDAGLTCTNEDLSRAWRCSVLGRVADKGFGYQLEGNLADSDVAVGSTLRLWEYGVGDDIRIAGHVTLLRDEAATDRFHITANVPVSVTARGATHELSAEQLQQTKGSVTVVIRNR